MRPLAAVQGRWRSPARVLAGGVVLLYAWWATSFRPFTWPMRITTAIPAVFLLVLASRDRRARSALRTWVASWNLVQGEAHAEARSDQGQGEARRTEDGEARDGREQPRRRIVWRSGTVVWSLLVAAIAFWELLARLHLPRSLYPTLSSLSDSVTRVHAVRFLVFVLWLLFGRDLLRR